MPTQVHVSKVAHQGPGVAVFIGFAPQAKLARFVKAGASAFNNPFLGLIQVTQWGASDRTMIGRGVLTTPTFVGPLC